MQVSPEAKIPADKQGAPLSFDNTEIAFARKSNDELRRTWKTFRKINNPFLSKVGPWLVKIGFKLRLPVEGIVRRTLFDVFCGGTSLEDTVKCQEGLDLGGVKTILDYSVEGEKTDEGFDATAAEIVRTIEFAAEHPAAVFSAMKTTGIAPFEVMEKMQRGEKLSAAEQQSADRAKARLEKICSAAARLKQPVFVDAEESWIQNTIDAWTEEMMVKYNQQMAVVYQTAQMYRHDRLAYLHSLIEKGKQQNFLIGVKVVRGAYIEKENERAKEKNYPTPIQKDKPSTDRDFEDALRLCVRNADRVSLCAGTHNDQSCLLLTTLMQEHNLPKNHGNIWFAQLLGMSDNISFNLAHHGYNVAKYVPYGPVRAVMPYLLRRADENSSIAGQSSRELLLLEKEMKRRGLR